MTCSLDVIGRWRNKVLQDSLDGYNGSPNKRTLSSGNMNLIMDELFASILSHRRNGTVELQARGFCEHVIISRKAEDQQDNYL